MPTPVEELKTKAGEMLPPDIAADVKAAIDRDAARRLDAPSGPEAHARPQSAWTGYLADDLYGQLAAGRFTGRPIVQWNGMDSFIFLQNPAEPFSYETAHKRIIKPATMATDGGTIPDVFRMLRKFSPWGYGPAFIIHDWLFEAHHGAIAPDNDWSFAQSAWILAECMKSLMETGFTDSAGKAQKLEKAEDTLYLVYQAVCGSTAKGYWDPVTS